MDDVRPEGRSVALHVSSDIHARQTIRGGGEQAFVALVTVVISWASNELRLRTAHHHNEDAEWTYRLPRTHATARDDGELKTSNGYGFHGH